MIECINAENFNEKTNSDFPVIVDFYADWCGPCVMIGRILEEIAEEEKEINIYKLNVDNDPFIATQFGVMNIPCMIVFKGGQEVARKIGACSKADILALVK